MFAVGFATFAVLYCVQPLMPVFSAEFDQSPAAASLTLSLTTAALAPMLLIAGSLSESFGRKPVMGLSLFASAALTLVSALATDFHQLLVLRFLTGIALAGLPSVSVAYLGEEMDNRSLGLAIGLFIGGSGLGGMSGRFAASVLADIGGWRLALAGIGGTGLICTAVFWRLLPPSRRFTAMPLDLGTQLRSLSGHFGDPGLRWLFLVGFLLMSGFVTIYNYVGYRLLAPPFNLSQTAVGALFSVYLLGIASSGLAGGLADRLGRPRMLLVMVTLLLSGGALTCSGQLWIVVLGVAVVTIGFFGAHAVASSWVAARARTAKAHAASLYTFCYYIGSSVVGTLGGFAWSYGGWNGVATLVIALQAVCLAVALRLMLLPVSRAAGG